jgi:hypothetical protein
LSRKWSARALWYLAANRTENASMTDTALQELKLGEKINRRGDHRDGMDVAVRPITRRKQTLESDDPTINVVH